MAYPPEYSRLISGEIKGGYVIHALILSRFISLVNEGIALAGRHSACRLAIFTTILYNTEQQVMMTGGRFFGRDIR